MEEKKKQYGTIYQSPVGKLTLISDGENLTKLEFEKEEKLEFSQKSLPILEATKKWLDCYFSGEEPKEKLKIKLQGTEFQKSVWKQIAKIPYGMTTTYGEIAKEIAKQSKIEKMSAQAVGNAVGSNPIAIIIPCHRVVGTKGNLTGFGGGLETKIQLLEIEKMDMNQFFVPKRRK